ncbi:MAG: hypothetical protein L0211_24610 [Planctomycetaceae bacterium]|nr:hypothetical protein [Planctomycetaceae bacterium]
MPDRGKLAVVAMFAVALAAATFAWWWNYSRGQRCLTFYGADAALLIRTAPNVELLELSPDTDKPEDRTVARLVVGERTYLIHRVTTISQAQGLIHARTSLVDDASFRWDAASGDCAGEVRNAIRFTDDANNSRSTLAFDFGCQRMWYAERQKSAALIPKVAQGWQSFLTRQVERIKGTPVNNSAD